MIIKNEKITILKSPHVNKSARDQFERKTYIKTVQIVFENKNINDKFLIKLLNLIKFLSLNVKIKFSVKK
jgi:ribosomal protein S10|tara:strand:- start:10239 stop:10448 length:210 start_codon:yes stop_codon:yes gene_type:complete